MSEYLFIPFEAFEVIPILADYRIIIQQTHRWYQLPPLLFPLSSHLPLLWLLLQHPLLLYQKTLRRLSIRLSVPLDHIPGCPQPVLRVPRHQQQGRHRPLLLHQRRQEVRHVLLCRRDPQREQSVHQVFRSLLLFNRRGSIIIFSRRTGFLVRGRASAQRKEATRVMRGLWKLHLAVGVEVVGHGGGWLAWTSIFFDELCGLRKPKLILNHRILLSHRIWYHEWRIIKLWLLRHTFLPIISQ